MSALNWGMIESGGAFESLVYTLLYDKDPSVILFGRPGKDSGQDARSKDGTRVYQAKFRNKMTMSIAIDLAKEELKKILEYCKPTHPNSKHWAHVTQWILVANITLNTNDKAAWQRDVVPAFRKIGITAEYWSLEILEPEIISRPHLRDVFFNGNNRTLICAREAFDWLSKISPGPSFLNTDLVGRQTSLAEVESFLDSPVSSILVVAGVHGVGKTRFLYDSMLDANKKEWRVLWGHTASMKSSSDWFRLLNSSSKTCVCIDGVDSRDFFKRILEQATTSERRNWKFILTIQPEHEFILQEFSTIKKIELKSLTQEESQQLSFNCLGESHHLIQSKEAFRLFPLTQGLPAWQCMILEECKKQPSFVLPETFPGFVRHHIDSGLATISPDLLGYARIMLRWFAAWNIVKIEESDPEEFMFLSEKGIQRERMEDVLSKLVECRLISKWGINGRSHAVEPAIIRQQILSDWLLDRSGDNHQHTISRDGRQFIEELLHFQIPNTPAILQNLCNMAVAYLPNQDSKQFLRPFFDELKRIANGDSIKEQYGVLELLKIIGYTNPDASLEVLLTLREHSLPDETVNNGALGASTLSHQDMLSSVAEYLFVVAKEAANRGSVQRFLAEIEKYLDFETKGTVHFLNGQKPSECLGRLIGSPRCSSQYTEVAVERLKDGWSSLCDNQFLKVALRSIWDPYKETIIQWGISFAFQRYHFVAPDNPFWKLCLEFRNKAFSTLQDAALNNESLRCELWSQLGHSVSQFDFLSSLIAADSQEKQLVLSRIRDDLQTTCTILSDRKNSFSVEELTEARKVWEPFLNGYTPAVLSSLAKRCEDQFQQFFEWPVQAMFASDAWRDERPIEQIVRRLKQKNNKSEWESFFDIAERYLSTFEPDARNANVVHIYKLVERYCQNEALTDEHPIMLFAATILQRPTPSPLERGFVIALGQHLILQAKSDLSSFSPETCLAPFLCGCPWKTEVLADIYHHPHPNSIGELTTREFQFLANRDQGFSPHQRASVLASFFATDPQGAAQLLSEMLDKSASSSKEQNELMWTMVNSIYMAGLRYDWASDQIPIDWTMDKILQLKLDANFLESAPLRWMRDATGWTFSMERFVRLIQSRIELESTEKPYDRFSVWPYHFPVDKWCAIGHGDEEQEAFDKLCEIAFEGGGYVALFECPELLPKIDTDGSHIEKFSTRYFANHPEIETKALYRLATLVAYYEEGSSGWRSIAAEIGRRSTFLPEKDRHRIYQGFIARRSSETWAIGALPEGVEKRVETKKLQYEHEPSDSPLKDYFEWAWNLAQKELDYAQQRAEEERHGDL